MKQKITFGATAAMDKTNTYEYVVDVFTTCVERHSARVSRYTGDASYVLSHLGRECQLPVPLKCDHDTSKNAMTIKFKNGVELSAVLEGEGVRYAVRLQDGTVKDVVTPFEKTDRVIDTLKPVLRKAMHAHNLREQLTERLETVRASDKLLLNYLLENYPRLMDFALADSVTMQDHTLAIVYSVNDRTGRKQTFLLTIVDSVPLKFSLNGETLMSTDDDAVTCELLNTLLQAAI